MCGKISPLPDWVVYCVICFEKNTICSPEKLEVRFCYKVENILGKGEISSFPTLFSKVVYHKGINWLYQGIS